MKNKKALFVIILVFVLLIGGAYVLYGRLSVQYQPEQLATQAPEETQDATEEAKIYAPDFTAVDADGNEVSLSDFLGKPVVLNFWASWCGPCKSEMPEFDEAYLQQGEHDRRCPGDGRYGDGIYCRFRLQLPGALRRQL